jgi:folate-binding protein YgfZ
MSTPDTFTFFQSEPGYLRITGEDQVDFLQRQTTNEIDGLQDNHHISTILTNPAARIVDVLQLFREDDDTLGVVTLPGRGGDTALFLKRRVFFMDKVKISDESENISIVDIEGPGAGDILKTLGLDVPLPNSVITGEMNGELARIISQAGPGGSGYRVIFPLDQQEHVADTLKTAGTPTISPEQYNALRVSAGIPGEAGELTDDFTPLETGLKHLISETKGCYTGQEVIARQITYDKITRSLIGIQLDGPVESGTRVLINEQNVGILTSYADTQHLGHRALAIIKRPHYEPGTVIQVKSNGHVVTGVVTKLPFPAQA